MERLVYSPTVQAFIRTEANGIVDVSDFIVSGSVNRVVNEVSTAELTLRNPEKRFTKPGNPTFRPMDGITIFASRYRDKPVQLFTGYLDSTPYLQLFPGTCSIRASCTLKRLLHTYWDAGLPHTQQFLSQFGWYANTQTGTIMSQKGAAQGSGLSTTGRPPTESEIKDALITDGSIGNLMWNVMVEIGNWDKDQILIEKLPPGILETVADIMSSFEDEDKELKKELDDFLGDLIGDYSGGSGTTSGNPPGGGSGMGSGSNPPSGTEVTPEQVGAEMLYAGFPSDEQVLANGMETMEHESGFGTAAGWDVEHDSGVLGYWQIQRSSHPEVSADCAMNLRCSTKAALGIWKAAGSCFACLDGPNPWQGGTDNSSKYLATARRCIEAAQNTQHHNTA